MPGSVLDPWLMPGCADDSWLCPNCVQAVAWPMSGSPWLFLAASWQRLGCFLDVSWVFPGCVLATVSLATAATEGVDAGS